MQINHIGSKCSSVVVLKLEIVTSLFIAIGLPLCIAASSLKHETFNALPNNSNIELRKHSNEHLGNTNICNVSFDDFDSEDAHQFCTHETNYTNNTNHLRPYLALSAFNEQVDPNFVALINPFWLKFNPAPANAHYTLGIIHSFIMVVGLFGNAIVIYMFIRCRSIRTPCNTLIINLAISDFFMLAKAPIVIYNSFKLGPALGEFVCRIYGFVGGLTGTASIATLTAISIDRYNVVVYPLEPLRSTTRRKCNIMVLIVWCYSITFSIVPALNIGFSKYVPEGYLTSCSFDYLDKTTKARIFMFVFFIFAWLIPFIIITYCYTYILKVVISSRHIRSSLDKHKTEKKLSLVVVGVIILWFVAWTPYSIVALLGISGNEDKISPFGSMIPAVFCKASACIDPYVYSISHPRFRKEFGRLFLGGVGTVRRRTSMKTSFVCYPSTGHPSIIRKQTGNDGDVVNKVKFGNKKNVQNSILKDEVECETDFSTNMRELNFKNDLVATEACGETIELDVVKN
ncbi:hypothetical protein HA402_016073 [Bradysia odoriphaga]|uniref:Ultraviolet-sensitive protein n=1 Tax=Bradysia odoriphaga TaxID=1564500 RepID=A0A510BUC8_9DIPT|nr:ultraviolet-sensitive protein [Bradysia odoriphaga]KAG4077086.1 hypothetical protein HA402_016073 [Bradysia odoriphaga]